jgi:CRP-like cAMP-binding protein
MATILKSRQKAPEMTLIGEGTAFKEKIWDYLESTALLSNLSHDEAYILSDWFKAYEALPGTEIMTEGSKDSCLCLLVEGKLDVYKEINPYERRKIASIQKGRSFGEMNLVDDQPHSATVVACEQSIILLVTGNNFEQLIEEHPKLGTKLLQRISRMISLRLRKTTGQLVDFLDH